MHLPIPSENRGFKLTKKDGLVLVTPAADKHKWDDSERWYRSAVIDEADNKIVSLGFPKFFNYGEHQGDTAQFEDKVRNHEPVWFSEKLDGSLAIRYVYNGEVYWRTRGTILALDPFDSMIEELAQAQTLLAYPEFMPNSSMLFELIHPGNRIIIKYDTPRLYLIGVVDHGYREGDVPKLWEPHDLRCAAQMWSVDAEWRAVHHNVEAYHYRAFIENTFDATGREGLVASWIEGGQTKLIKIKSEEYKKLHAVMFGLSDQQLLEWCQSHDVRDGEDFLFMMQQQAEVDWEFLEAKRPIVKLWLEVERRASEDYAGACEIWQLYKNLPRKKFAQIIQGCDNPHLIFMLYDGVFEQAYQKALSSWMEWGRLQLKEGIFNDGDV